MEEKEYTAENSLVECYHDWRVILEVKTAKWEDFMSYRGVYSSTKRSDLVVTDYQLTHTLICNKCKRIKKV